MGSCARSSRRGGCRCSGTRLTLPPSPLSGVSAPSGNTCRLLARDHAAPESTLALSKANQPCCGRVRPLDASMLSSGSERGVGEEESVAVAGELAFDAAHRLAFALASGQEAVAAAVEAVAAG